MNSKQGSRYIKRRMGNDLKQKILVQNGKVRNLLIVHGAIWSMSIENKYCSKCSYPLVPSAFDEIKEAENMKIQQIQQKYEQDMKSMREEMNLQFNQILSMIQQNPALANVKPEILSNKAIS